VNWIWCCLSAEHTGS